MASYAHELGMVAARFCEGGHICTLPRECCTQGCCPPPYQSGPRQLPPASEHVLNLFFISHWFFWCVVVAVILAVLCAYSLWKKRRTVCGWGFNEHHVQSEGDSAGSCYAPPQYSRCNSFHHPPPPYTEVTSKPDLYPLVFTCNTDNGKNGSSYLMVQYFRNYIVRPPAGSLSAASTVDSLSSSFICNVNEANTLVPPPYSRAASPEIGYSNYFQPHYTLPRSASQLVCLNTGMPNSQEPSLTMQQAYDQRNSLYTAVGGHMTAYEANLLPAGSYEQDNNERERDRRRQRDRQQRSTSFMQAASVPRYMVNSNSSISDIFVNGALNSNTSTANHAETVVDMTTTIATSSPDIASLQSNVAAAAACIQTNPLHRLGRHSVSFSSHSPLHYSRHSVEGTRSLAAESTVAITDNSRCQDLNTLRHSLESCRQLLHRQRRPATMFNNMDGANLSLNEVTDYTNGEAGVAQSLINSLANIEGATDEVKEILEQIRQLQEGVSLEEIFKPTSRPMLQHTLSTPTPASTKRHSSADNNLQRCLTMPTEQQHQKHASSPSFTRSNTSIAARPTTVAQQQQQQQQQLAYSNKKKFFTPKPNKALYIPMVACNQGQSPPPSRGILKSPVSSVVGTSFFINRGRGRKVWVSRSAPSTPGTCLPPNCFGDDSPLLNEHEEDPEGEQNAELEHV